MTVSVVLGILAAIAVIDMVSTALVRKEAQRQAALLYLLPAPKVGSLPNLEEYPEVLRAYILASRFYEKPHKGDILRMRQKGAVRFRAGQGWKPFEAKCFVAAQSGPALVWYADVTMGFLCSRAVLHILSRGIARWSEKIWGFNMRPFFSNHCDIHTCLLMEYYTTAGWHPGIWLTPALDWKTSGEGTLVARAVEPNFPLTLTLRFGPDALLETLLVELGDSTWTATYSGYQEVGGLMVPLAWTVETSIRESKWLYLEGKVTDMVSGGEFSWW